MENMLRLSSECYVKWAHPQCADVVTIRKIAYVEDDCLETDVPSASSSVNAIYRQEVHRGPSVGKVPLL
jgi:hypothetical protein